jgi:transmembrane sensor
MNNSASERRHLVLQEASEWLIRLQDESCTDSELEAWGHWMQLSPQHAAAFDDLSALWEASSQVNSAAVLRARGAERARSHPTTVEQRRPTRWPMRFAAGIAASFLVVALVWVLASRPGHDAATQVFATNVGERRQVTLADGSTVVLDAATEIRIRYDTKRRDIELRTGQAFFSVAHAPERPFIVVAGDVQSRALGTRFAVGHRANREVAVTIVEGRVRVSQAAPGRVASAVEVSGGQQVTFSEDAGLHPPLQVNAELATTWREGVVIYQGESLANVIADLNRYSRVPVRLEDPALGQLKVTGRWELAAIDQWVDGLARASGTRIKRSANGILLIREDTQNRTEVGSPREQGGGN